VTVVGIVGPGINRAQLAIEAKTQFSALVGFY
jgi:hypothetical protein